LGFETISKVSHSSHSFSRHFTEDPKFFILHFSGEPVALFKHHTQAITSVEWLPSDNSVFSASGSDNQITVWDLAVEKDDQVGQEEKPVDVPPQLLFIHMVCNGDISGVMVIVVKA
jgi:WD40 repeat protein